MFYEERPDKALRFGDIVEGFVLSAPHVDEPSETDPVREYHIEVNRPQFAVVLTPCCSIGYQTLTLSPLLHVRPSFFSNPYFADDLTNINRVMFPQDAVSPDVWEKLSTTERDKRLSVGKGYAFLDCFIYAPHDLLPDYTLHRKGGNTTTGHFMIEFSRIYRVECGQVKSPHECPLSVKLLQLSIPARMELRQKLAAYFGRMPKEDEL